MYKTRTTWPELCWRMVSHTSCIWPPSCQVRAPVMTARNNRVDVKFCVHVLACYLGMDNLLSPYMHKITMYAGIIDTWKHSISSTMLISGRLLFSAAIGERNPGLALKVNTLGIQVCVQSVLLCIILLSAANLDEFSRPYSYLIAKFNVC